MRHMAIQNTLADLQAATVNDGDIVFLLCKSTSSDGLGGFYRWDASSTVAADTTFMNTVVSNQSATGRWVRVFQRAATLPQGVLVNMGGVKTLFATAICNSSGQATVNLTMDNTTTGVPIFNTILSNTSKCIQAQANPTAAIDTYVVSQSTTSTTHGAYKPNAVSLTVGLLYNPYSAVAAGTPLSFRVDGM